MAGLRFGIIAALMGFVLFGVLNASANQVDPGHSARGKEIQTTISSQWEYNEQ